MGAKFNKDLIRRYFHIPERLGTVGDGRRKVGVFKCHLLVWAAGIVAIWNVGLHCFGVWVYVSTQASVSRCQSLLICEFSLVNFLIICVQGFSHMAPTLPRGPEAAENVVTPP